MKKSIVSIATLLSVSLSTFAAPSPSSLLMSAYCSNTGTHTLRALTQSDQLADTLELLEATEACDAMASSTNTLLSSIQSLESLNQSETNIEKLNTKLTGFEEQLEIEKANLIATHIQNFTIINPGATQSQIDASVAGFVPSSNLLSDLELRVNELKLDLFSGQLDSGFAQNSQELRNDKIKLIGSNINSLLGAISTSNSCTNSNESIAPAIISNVLGVASTALTGVAGIAVGISAKLLAGSRDLIRNMKYKSARRRIDIEKMKEAIPCSFQGITETYCKARDTKNLIDFYAENELNTECIGGECDLLKTGISLLSKKTSVLNSWVNLILSGASPRNEGLLGPYRSAIYLRAAFDDVKQVLEGMINGARYQLSLPGVDAVSVKRELMEKLAKKVSDNTQETERRSGSTPFSRFFQKDPRCGAWAYFFKPNLDPSNAEDRTLGISSDLDCGENARSEYSAAIDVSVLQERIKVMNEETSKTVAFEIQLVSEENTSNILMKYNAKDNIFKTSPRIFVKKALSYYGKFEKYIEDKALDRPLLVSLITRAKKQLLKTQKIVYAQNCTDLDSDSLNNTTASLSKEQELRRNENCDLNAEKLANLSLTLAPNQQVLSVENSLRSIFREHVEMVKDSGDITDESILLILNSSSEDGSNILVRNSLNTQQVYEDAMTAMSITHGNLQNFWKNFSKSIVRVLKKIKEDKNSFLLGKICVSAAIAPITKSQKRKIEKYCAGSVYKSTSRQIKDIKYNDIVNLEFEDKACDLYNFKRKLNVFNNQ